MNALSLCIGVNIAADSLCGGDGKAPGHMTMRCCWCLEKLDPNGELSVRRVPLSLDPYCLDCGIAQDVLFVTVPRAS